MRKMIFFALLLTLVCPAMAQEAKRMTPDAAGSMTSCLSSPAYSGRDVFEGFEDGVPPAGWQIDSTNPTSTWEQDSDSWVIEGTYCARIWGDNDVAQDEVLSFDHTVDVAGGEYILSFWCCGVTGQEWDLNATETVEINGVEMWNFDEEVIYGHYLYWHKYFIDLSVWDGQTVTIGFRYAGIGGDVHIYDCVMVDDGTGWDPDWPAPQPNDNCELAMDNGYYIPYGDFSIDADNTDAWRDYALTYQSCVYYGFTGHDLVWIVEMEEGDELHVEMNSTPFWDEVFWLATDCADPIGSCVAHGDEPPNMTYTAAATGIYYLICGGWTDGPNYQGPFTLTGYLHGAGQNGPMIVTGPGPGPDNLNLVHSYHLDGNWNADVVVSAYGAGAYGITVATGDVDGDSFDELLTGPGPGAMFGPQVRGFGYDGNQLDGLNFFAYGTLKYGVNVASAELDGDGYDEIITGAGPGAVFGPHVRGWNYDGSGTVSSISGVSYFAYGTPKWGVNVCAGDLDGDGYDEIVTGAGPGAVYGPHVRGWNYDNNAIAAMSDVSFLAYGTNKYGVNVACGDIDGDGYAEIVTGAGPGAVFGPHVRGWNVDGGTAGSISAINFFAFDYSEWGCNVGCGDIDGDGIDEVLVGAGPGAGYDAWVRAYNYDGGTLGDPVHEFTAFDSPNEDITHGVNVAVGQF